VLFPSVSALYLYEANATNRVLKFMDGVTPTERIVQADNANPRGANLEAALRQRGDGGVYSALLTTYVQAYVSDQLSGPTPAALLLSPTLRRTGTLARENPLSLDRVIIDAQNIRLRVYYTKPSPR
jgi:hypothetical protein